MRQLGSFSLSLALSLVCAGSLSAQTVYFTSFEAPDFNAGSSLNGQAGWAVTNGFQVQTQATDPGVNPVPHDGTQMARSTTSAVAGVVDRFARVSLVSGWDARTAGNNVLVSDVAIYLPSATNTETSWFGMRAHSTTSVDSHFGGLVINGLSGQAGMWDGTDFTSSSVTVTHNAWHMMRLVADFDSGNVTGYVNGHLVGNTTFDTTAFPGITHIRLWNRKPDATTTAQIAFFDSYDIQAVPEPATLIALGAGALALLRRRRSK